MTPMPNRRAALAATASAVIVTLVPCAPRSARADDDLLAIARAAILKGRTPRRELITMEAPELAENGNAVTVTIDVDLAATPQRHVTAIHVLAEKNPLANVVSCTLGPRSGRAKIATTIRLADSQRIIALAELSTGDVVETEAAVVVTIAACLDAG
jgi:sulfur-oxidizing protein SoxY